VLLSRGEGFATGILLIGDVKFVQKAMQDRREYKAGHRDQRESAVERVQ